MQRRLGLSSVLLQLAADRAITAITAIPPSSNSIFIFFMVKNEDE